MATKNETDSRTWAITSKRLLDGSKGPVVQDAIVVVEGDRISAAGPATQITIPPGAEVLEAGDRTVMPGMIDAHVHMLSTGSNASGVETRALNDSQAMLLGARNALMAKRSGLTTVRDCGDRKFLSLTLRDSIGDGVIPGPRMVCSGRPITSTAGQLWWNGIESDSEDDLRRAVRTLVKSGVDFIKFVGSGGNATPGSNPEASQYDAAGFQAVADDAHRMGKKVAAHVHGVESIRLAVDAGMDTLEHCPFRANGTIEYDESIVLDIVSKGLIVSLAMPATWYRLRAEDMRDTRAHPGHLWEGRYDTIRRMHAAGVKLVVSSDQGSTGTRIEELALLMELLVDRIKIPAADVIYGVTGLAAEAVGLEDTIGTLEPGKMADIMVVDGDPLTEIGAMNRVHTVVKSGELVVSEGAVVWPAGAQSRD